MAPSSHQHLDPARASGALSAEARPCQGQILNLATAPPSTAVPALARGRTLHLLSSCASQGPPWGQWEALQLLDTHTKSEETAKNYRQLAIVCSHYSLPSALGIHTLVWKSLKKKKKFWINHIWLMINDKEQSKPAVSLLVMISAHF